MRPTEPEEPIDAVREEPTLARTRPRTEPTRLVTGTFPDEASAEDAVHRLIQSGFDARRDVALVEVRFEHTEVPLTHRAEAAAGIAIGVGVCGMIGAFLGLLVGNGVLPPVEGLVGGGPVRAMLQGGVLGALAGGLGGAIRWLGVAWTSGPRAPDGPKRARVGVRAASEERVRSALLVLRDAGAIELGGLDSLDELPAGF